MAEGTDMNQIEKAMSDYLGEMCGMRLKPHALTGLAKAAIAAQSSIRAPRIGVRSTTQLSPPRPQEAVMQSDIVQEARLDAKAFRENAVYTSDGQRVKLGANADRLDAYANHMDAQAAEITRLTEALRAAEEREKALREALEEISDLPGEINPCNYDHDDACELNRQFCYGLLIARQALAGAKP